MIERFLKVKHWQLFLALFGIPFLLNIFMMVTFASEAMKNDEPNLEYAFEFIALLPLLGLLWVAIFFGWFWSIAVGLQNMIPENIKMNIGRFKLFFFIPFIYIVLLFVIIGGSIAGEGVLFSSTENPSILFFSGIAIIIPLHFFAMFCMFHTLYFAAKTIKTAELQRETSFSDFVGEFFLIWFYPFGVWMIQPKVNELYEGSSRNEFEKYY